MFYQFRIAQLCNCPQSGFIFPGVNIRGLLIHNRGQLTQSAFCLFLCQTLARLPNSGSECWYNVIEIIPFQSLRRTGGRNGKTCNYAAASVHGKELVQLSHEHLQTAVIINHSRCCYLSLFHTPNQISQYNMLLLFSSQIL